MPRHSATLGYPVVSAIQGTEHGNHLVSTFKNRHRLTEVDTYLLIYEDILQLLVTYPVQCDSVSRFSASHQKRKRDLVVVQKELLPAWLSFLKTGSVLDTEQELLPDFREDLRAFYVAYAVKIPPGFSIDNPFLEDEPGRRSFD